MEDVLDLYHEPYDPAYPVVCFDESPYQLVSEVRKPVPAAPSQPARIDYEYRREGTCNLFMLFEPQRGWRHVDVTPQRTAVDFAHQMRDLVDVHYPRAILISVVLDNLNTHTPAALYEVFPPAEARRILYRLEFRYTPKHGSWLNMAEIEFGVIRRQCLEQRIATIATVRRKVAAWEARRNAASNDCLPIRVHILADHVHARPGIEQAERTAWHSKAVLLGWNQLPGRGKTIRLVATISSGW